MSISYQRVMIISGIDNRGLISMDEIIICRHCGKPEYYGKMRWLNGVCSCRSVNGKSQVPRPVTKSLR